MRMSSQKIAVVTGGNKGIGYAIVKGLCERFDGIVYLTARDSGRGKAAVSKLEKEHNLKPIFRQLDITDQSSVNDFKEFIKKEHGGLDILINNAAIAFNVSAPEPFSIQAKETIRVNYFGTLRVCDALFPLLRNNAKVVNVSSSLGHLYKIPSEELRKEFSKNDLTVPELNKLVEKFVKAAENDKAVEDGWGFIRLPQAAENDKAVEGGWGSSTYVVSKVAVSALTNIQQKLFDEEVPNRNISVNSVHPGYVDTDMTNHKGPLSIEEGAKSSLFAALDANLKGKYIWNDCKVVDWFTNSAPLN